MPSDLHMERRGPESGLPIVLLHGLGGTWRIWQPVFDDLAAQHPVVGIDIPGFGQSPPPAGPWTLPSVAELISTAVRDAGIDQYVLVGHSLGGNLAMHMAAAAPAAVRALNLISPAGLVPTTISDPRPSIPLVYSTWHLVAAILTPGLKISRWLRHRTYGRLVVDPDVLSPGKAHINAVWSNRAKSKLAARTAILAAADLPVAERLSMPTRVLWGRDDQVTDAAMAGPLADHLPGTPPVTILERCGHMPMWEHPAEVLRSIAASADDAAQASSALVNPTVNARHQIQTSL